MIREAVAELCRTGTGRIVDISHVVLELLLLLLGELNLLLMAAGVLMQKRLLMEIRWNVVEHHEVVVRDGRQVVVVEVMGIVGCAVVRIVIAG